MLTAHALHPTGVGSPKSRIPACPTGSSAVTLSQSKHSSRCQLPPQTYLLPRVWHEQSLSDTMSPPRLAHSCLRREPPSHALHRSRAGIHLLLRTPQKATQLQRFSPDENQRPLFDTDRKRLGRMRARLGGKEQAHTHREHLGTVKLPFPAPEPTAPHLACPHH